MPTYEYRCKDCGQELEVVQSFTDDALTTCEACGGQLRKVFGNVGIAFKGSGFYKNDSRGKPSKAAGGSDTAGDAAASSGDKAGEGGGAAKDAGSTPKKVDAATPAPKVDKPKSPTATPT